MPAGMPHKILNNDSVAGGGYMVQSKAVKAKAELAKQAAAIATAEAQAESFASAAVIAAELAVSASVAVSHQTVGEAL